MSDQTLSADPVAAILAAKGTPLRAIACVLAVVGILLPAFSSSGFGLAETTSLLQINGMAVGFPVVIILAMLIPGIAPLRPYGRLVDLVTVLVGLGVLIHAAFVFFDAQHQIGQTIGNLMPHAVTLTPTYGLAFVVLGSVVMGFQAMRNR